MKLACFDGFDVLLKEVSSLFQVFRPIFTPPSGDVFYNSSLEVVKIICNRVVPGLNR